jgi:Ca-activated chloride channel family protein
MRNQKTEHIGMDGLLRERARLQQGADEAFLEALDRRLDEVDSAKTNVEAEQKTRGSWIIASVAAVVAVGIGIASVIVADRDRVDDWLDVDVAHVAKPKTVSYQVFREEPTVPSSPVPTRNESSVGEEDPLVAVWDQETAAAAQYDMSNLELPGDMLDEMNKDGLGDIGGESIAIALRPPLSQPSSMGEPQPSGQPQPGVRSLNLAAEWAALPKISRPEIQALEDARLEMVNLMDKFTVVDLGAGLPGWTQDTPETGKKQLVMQGKMSTLQADKAIAAIESQLADLSGLSGSRLIEEAVAQNVVDGSISALYPEKKKLAIELESLQKAGLGVSHPEVEAARVELAIVDAILEKGVIASQKSLETRLEIAKTSLANLEGIEARQESESMEERRRYTLYVEAKRRYETLNANYLASIAANQTPPKRERYPELVDQPFRSPTKAPLSTFSVDVDTASFTNVRRMIRSGLRVPPNAVRIEELINFFDYAYPNPGQELPFSVNLESASCPWAPDHRLVRIGLKGKEIHRAERPPINLVFLLDVSGSMSDANKLPLVQESIQLLINELHDDDKISIVTYAGSEGIALNPTSGANKEKVRAAVAALRSGGSTNGEGGLRLAYRLATENFVEGGVNRILLATDGDFNVGESSTDGLRGLVKEKAGSGVFISVLGFGTGNLNDSMLEAITNDGNGTYHYVDGIDEGRRVLVDGLTGTMINIAKDVKVQVEFNPSKVGAYRLIGYANRKLPPEAFADDRIDAGDIGAGHTVTAFYEIVPSEIVKSQKVVDDLKYQRPAAPEPPSLVPTGSDELMTVKLRYKEPAGSESKLIEVPLKDTGTAFEQASPDFRFASSVAAFGMALRGSPYRGTMTNAQIVEMAQSAAGTTAERVDFVGLIRQSHLP